MNETEFLPQTEPYKESSNKKTLISVFAVVVLIGLLILGFTSGFFKSSLNSEPKIDTKAVLGETQELKDPEGNFSFEVPADWQFIYASKPASVVTQSKDFKVSLIGTTSQILYENGAVMGVFFKTGPLPDVTGGKELMVAGQKGFYFNRVSERVHNGKIFETQIPYRDGYYSLSFTYNPQTFPDGEKIFEAVLSTFKFIR